MIVSMLSIPSTQGWTDWDAPGCCITEQAMGPAGSWLGGTYLPCEGVWQGDRPGQCACLWTATSSVVLVPKQELGIQQI